MAASKDEYQPSTPDRQWRRRLLEASFFVFIIAVLWTVDTLTKINIRNFQGGPDDFRLIVHQVTSAIVVLALVPAVAWWLSRFPLRRDMIFAAIVGHVVGSGLFAIAHYFSMVGLRYISYTLYGRDFIFSDFWIRNVIVEYQKDIKIYLGIVAIISVYRYYRRQEASNVSTEPDRLIVQTGSGETIIRQEDIEYLEAARNYVVVGTADREYLIRETLGHLEQTLATAIFVRTHRSYLVNLDRIEEIRTTGSGGRQVRMQCGKLVPLSRGHRESFRRRVSRTT
jgi:hypothetical protein